MSAENISSFRSKKNCLLVFRNKKINNFEGAEKLISEFSDIGYYFDKIAYIAYDRAEEIVNALRDGKTNYQNVFIYCPNSMDDTMKAFLQALPQNGFCPIAGSQPYARNLPPGCLFAGRCPKRTDACAGKVEMRTLRGGEVRCICAE